jgi:DNA-binding transcriptional LysR family regulator
MDLSTDFLRSFIAVCDCKSFSLAAARVHKSQGAISAQIAKLEEQAGSKLIDRSQREFKLTNEGELFRKFAQGVVAETDAMQRSLQAFRNRGHGEVRIGATRSVGTYVLLDAIGKIARDFPDLKISLLTQGRALTYERLRQRSVDLAVVLAEAAPKGFFVKPLRSEPLSVVISANHPLANKKVISREELRTVPFIVGIKGNDFSDMVEEFLQTNGLPRPIRGVTINSLQARKEAARAGIGITILPMFAVRDELERKTLKSVAVKEWRLPDTRLMIVEAHRRSPNANVELVKKVLEEHLMLGPSDYESFPSFVLEHR